MADGLPGARPAYYAARPGGWRDWWTLLHPPYTAWHLAYVVIGACLVAPVHVMRLIATVLAFFLAVGVGAHALDELHGRPLGTTIPSWQLVTAAACGIGGAVVLGVVGAFDVGPVLIIFIVVGVVLAVGYNLELLGGTLHSDTMFAASWGAFPLLTAYFAQHDTLSVASGAAAAFAFFLSGAQRQLSTPARTLRRRARTVEGAVTLADGTAVALHRDLLLAPLESALRSLSWAVVALAVALALAQLHPW